MAVKNLNIGLFILISKLSDLEVKTEIFFIFNEIRDRVSIINAFFLLNFQVS